MTSQPVPPMQFAFDISNLGLCFYLDESVLLGGFHSLDAVGVSLQADRIGDRGILYVDPMDLRYAHIYRTYSPEKSDCRLRNFNVDIHGDMEWQEEFNYGIYFHGSSLNFPTMGTFMVSINITAVMDDPIYFGRCTWGLSVGTMQWGGGWIRQAGANNLEMYLRPAWNPEETCIQYSKTIYDLAATNRLCFVRALYSFLTDNPMLGCDEDIPEYDPVPPITTTIDIMVKELPFYI